HFLVPSQAMAVDHEPGEILVHKAILVLKSVTRDIPEPRHRREFAGVVETGPVERELVSETAIQKRREFTTAVGDLVAVEALVVVITSDEPMPPPTLVDHQFQTAEQIVLPRKLVLVRRQHRITIELPKRLHANTVVRVPHPQTHSYAVCQCQTKISALR